MARTKRISASDPIAHARTDGAPPAPFALETPAAIVALALANYAMGRLGLLLAIPPGFATAVFPPSGIAVAALLLWGTRLWPGVFLGSFCFNLHLAVAASPDATLVGAAPVAACIALGSSVQAVVAVTLIRRSTRAPTELTDESDVFALLLLAGPVACGIASTWGVTTLALADLLAEGRALYSWFTWWVGDTIGVLVFTPLVLVAFAPRRSLWRPRALSVGLPLVVACALVVMVFVVVSEREDEAIASGFRRRVEALDRDLYRDLEAHAEVLWSIRSFFAGSQEVGSEEFRIFVDRALSAHPGLRALSWNPVVRDEDREAFESAVAAFDGHPLEIRERDATGRLVPAARRPSYVVVQYIEPLAENAPARGFDVLSEPIRRRTLERARDSGEPAASPRIELVQARMGGYGFLLVLPIYASDETPVMLPERRSELTGFAVAVIEIDPLLESALAGAPVGDVEIEVWDRSAPGDGDRLARYPASPSDARPDPAAVAHRVVTEHHVGGRRWDVRFQPTAGYLTAQPSWQAWAVLAGGLTFSGLLGALLLVVTGRVVVEAERRQEIAAVRDRLARANEELDRFAYAASHDLRTPLRGVAQLSEFLLSDFGKELPEEACEYVEMIQSRIIKLTTMLDDLLRYSRVGWSEGHPQPVDTARLASEIVALTPGSERYDVRIVDLPEIVADRAPLDQVLRNLYTNAIKHHDGPRGEIEFSCRVEGGRYVFSVRDDGPGIPRQDRERVFEMFRTAGDPAKDADGASGMGLAIVRRIVSHQGGEVWIESGGVRGTTVSFSWPRIER